MSEKSKKRQKEAEFRLSIIGPLLSMPPDKGQLQKELKSIAGHLYFHPTKKIWRKFNISTVERWYYQAHNADDPIKALSRKIRSDAGKSYALTHQQLDALRKQYKQYSHWSYKLHSDNLEALVVEKPGLGVAPSYATVLRRMKEQGWYKKKRTRTAGQKKAAERLEQREVRSYESEFVHALWHLDFHGGSLRVVDEKGDWDKPHVLAILDDRSRLCCHIQWFTDETTGTLFHGLSQAFIKRGLPRGLMMDNGSAMKAHETLNGLSRLGINDDKTLPYSPYQNGKQESFWEQVEGRLVAMLSSVKPLTLNFLNYSTQAWVEQEYNRSVHEEIGCAPIERVLKEKEVSRSAPDYDALRFAFTEEQKRTQRRSDGTLSINGVRFEVPSRFRHFPKLYVRYQNWDQSIAWLVDDRTGNQLARIYPLDKSKNSNGARRTLAPLADVPSDSGKEISEPIPPLLRKYIAEYAATGLPPAYLPKEKNNDDE